MTEQNSMLTGKPIKSIIKFSLPIMASSLLQYNYTLVDNILVGRYVSTDALAAVGGVASINSFIVGAALGLTSGFTIPVAHAYGAKDQDRVNRYSGSSITVSFLLGLLLVVVAHIYFHSSFEAYRHAGRNSRPFLGVCKHSLLCNTVSDALKQFYRNFKSRR